MRRNTRIMSKQLQMCCSTTSSLVRYINNMLLPILLSKVTSTIANMYFWKWAPSISVSYWDWRVACKLSLRLGKWSPSSILIWDAKDNLFLSALTLNLLSLNPQWNVCDCYHFWQFCKENNGDLERQVTALCFVEGLQQNHVFNSTLAVTVASDPNTYTGSESSLAL